MSVFQSKKTLTTADPRLVLERMLTVPGMSFIASSTGRVIVAIISFAGMAPLSIRMTTRGKSVCGNTADGIVTAEYPPATHNADTSSKIPLLLASTRAIRPPAGVDLGSTRLTLRSPTSDPP